MSSLQTARHLIKKAFDMLENENQILKNQNLQLRAELDTNHYLNKSAAARFVGVSHTTINRWIDSGKLRCTNGRIRKIDLIRIAEGSYASIKGTR